MHRKSAVPKHKNTKRTGASPILSKIIEKGPQYEILSRFFTFLPPTLLQMLTFAVFVNALNSKDEEGEYPFLQNSLKRTQCFFSGVRHSSFVSIRLSLKTLLTSEKLRPVYSVASAVCNAYSDFGKIRI